MNTVAARSPGSRRWRWYEIGFWLLVMPLNAIFNVLVARLDHPDLPAWYPWVWETSSGIVLLVLLPAVALFEARWPIRLDNWPRRLPLHLAASLAFSLLHVAGMVALRVPAYAAAGETYHFGGWWSGVGYEYLKDARTYFLIVTTLALYRLWRLRRQGEARLLAAPDDAPPVEPVERPQRFLVRKLGKEFLVNASEIEWLQAAGNYVNLSVRGRSYPLRATMTGMAGQLDPARFVRVHRSYFVNLDFLAHIEPLESGDARLHMRDGTTIPCSRRHRDTLRGRLDA